MKNNFTVIKAMVAELGFEHEHNGLSEPHAGCFSIPSEEESYEEGRPTFFITRKDDGDLCPTSLEEPVTLVCGNFGDQNTVEISFPNITKLVEAYTYPGGGSVNNLVVTMVCEYDKITGGFNVVKLNKYALINLDTITVIKVLYAKDKESIKEDALLPGHPVCILLEEYEIQSLLDQFSEIMEE